MLVNGRRAQGRSRTRTCAPVRALSLTDPSTPADLGRAGRRCATISGSASLSDSGQRPLNLISGGLVLEPKPISHMLGKEEAGLDGTNLLAGIEAMDGPGHTSIPVRRTQGFSEPARPTNSLRRLERCSLRHDALLQIPPERHDQLARQSHQRDPTHAACHRADTGAVPTGQSAARLMPQPQPCQFDGASPRSRVARPSDALVASDAAALPGDRDQPQVAADLLRLSKLR